MMHSKAGKEPDQQPEIPLTVDSFDPLRDAETLLEDQAAGNPGTEAPGRDRPHTDPARRADGPDDPGEDG